MERVSLSLESTIPELKSYTLYSLFTGPELEQITCRRRVFEQRLVRRTALRADYEEYISYETKLGKLLAMRLKKLPQLPPGTVALFAIQRRIIILFKHMVKKFFADPTPLLAFIAYAKSLPSGSPKLVSKLYASLLSLHPNPASYIDAAAYYTHSVLNISAARSVFLAAVRIHASSSVEVWVQFVKMELINFERKRRRELLLAPSSSSSKPAPEPGNVQLINAVIRNAVSQLSTKEKSDSFLLRTHDEILAFPIDTATKSALLDSLPPMLSEHSALKHSARFALSRAKEGEEWFDTLRQGLESLAEAGQWMHLLEWVEELHTHPAAEDKVFVMFLRRYVKNTFKVARSQGDVLPEVRVKFETIISRPVGE